MKKIYDINQLPSMGYKILNKDEQYQQPLSMDRHKWKATKSHNYYIYITICGHFKEKIM